MNNIPLVKGNLSIVVSILIFITSVSEIRIYCMFRTSFLLTILFQIISAFSWISAFDSTILISFLTPTLRTFLADEGAWLVRIIYNTPEYFIRLEWVIAPFSFKYLLILVSSQKNSSILASEITPSGQSCTPYKFNNSDSFSGNAFLADGLSCCDEWDKHQN